MPAASPSEVRVLERALKFGLCLSVLGTLGFGSWWICCSSHALRGGHHDVFLEHEHVEHLNSHVAQAVADAAASQGSKGGQQKQLTALDAAEVATGQVAKGIPPEWKLRQPVVFRAAASSSSSEEEQAAAARSKKLIAALNAEDSREQRAFQANNPPSKPLVVAEQQAGTQSTGRPEDRGQQTIFLSIAAYREQRGPKCIAHAFAMAKNPDRIFVGLYQQWDPEKDPDGTDFDAYCSAEVLAKGAAKGKPPHPICTRKDHVTKVEIHWTGSEGPCVARAKAELMYRGQDFAMQIDAHSTFVQDWDEMLIRMWAQTGNEYAVLSGYPRSESEMDRGSQNFRNIPMICSAKMLDWSCRDMLKNNPGFSPMRKEPVRTPYFGAGLVFSRGHRLERVPYDPYLHYLFDGEEFDLAMRLFTHGYDIYAPNETPLFHFYSSPALNKKMKIAKFWDYQWGKRFPIMFRSTRRIRHKVGIAEVLAQDPKINETELTELARYGPGTKRTVGQYLKYAGLDLVKKKSPGACRHVRDGLKHVPWSDPAEDPLLHPTRDQQRRPGR